MLIVCPNCATSYGVEMASLRLDPQASLPALPLGLASAALRYRQALVAADAMPPVRCTLAAIAQAAADAARTTLPRLRRATAVLADELEAGRSRADRTPTPPAGSPAEPVGTKPARATVTPPSQHISAGVARVIGAVRQQSWWRSWRLSWWRSWLRSYDLGDYRGGGGGRHCHVCSALFSDLR